jgi:hypothetical protein
METLDDSILRLLGERAKGKTICPSDVLAKEDKQDSVKMEMVRDAARRLVEMGKIEITQKGQVVDPLSIKGPIRLRLKG